MSCIVSHAMYITDMYVYVFFYCILTTADTDMYICVIYLCIYLYICIFVAYVGGKMLNEDLQEVVNFISLSLSISYAQLEGILL